MATELAQAYVQIIPSADGISGKLQSLLGGEAQSVGASIGGIFSGALGSAVQMGVNAIAGLSNAVIGFGKSAVNAGMSFDSSMSQVAATMGYSLEELNTVGSEASATFEQLSAFAQEMGSTTAFSASEAADALNYMALAGYDAETSMQMLPNVLNLAAAGGIDLASASDMVTDAQSALGLSLDETSIMVDQMAAAASKSNTSVQQLGDAFLTIGANAKSLSGGTTELATALGILADNGIKGTEGGTHLRNIMLALNPTTDKAAAAWEALGVSAYDADGSLRPLEDTFADLNEAMEGMTDQEKTDIITSMFNKTDLASVNALLATSSERWEELGAAIADSEGAASDMAEVQLDNLNGDITLFQSALEGAQIALSDQLTPALREFVQFGSQGLSELTIAFKEGGVEGLVKKAGELLTDFGKMIGNMAPEMVSAGLTLIDSLIDGLIVNLPAVMTTATTIISKLGEFIVNDAPKLLVLGVTLIGTLVKGIADNIGTLVKTATSLIIEMAKELTNPSTLTSIISAGLELIVNLVYGVLEALPMLLESMPIIVDNVVTVLLDCMPLLIDAGFKLFSALLDNLPQIITLVAQATFQIADTLINKLIEKGPDIAKNGYEMFMKLLQKVPGFIVEMGKSVKNIVDKLIEFFTNKFDQIKNIGKDIVDNIWNGISEGWGKLKSDVEGLVNGLVDGIKGIFSSADYSDSISTSMNVAVNDATGFDARNGAFTPGAISQNPMNGNMFNLLAEYLPIIASGRNVNISLEGDTEGLFTAVRNRNTLYTQSTNYNPMVSG